MTTVVEVDELAGGGPVARFEGRQHGAAVSLFLVRFAPGAGPPPHRHPYDETFVVQDGAARFVVDGEEFEAVAGQIVVVPRGAAHSFVVTGERDLRLISIHPSDRFVQEWLPDEAAPGGRG
jgi:quercetin dioxygenase-like cupin family protein